MCQSLWHMLAVPAPGKGRSVVQGQPGLRDPPSALVTATLVSASNEFEGTWDRI